MKYHESLLPVMHALFRRGCTNEQLCEVLGISERGLYNWKKKYPAVLQAFEEKKNNVAANAIVEDALFKEATGYYYTEDVATKDGVHQVSRYARPVVLAALAWLRNRCPDRWQHNPGDDGGKNVNFNNLQLFQINYNGNVPGQMKPAMLEIGSGNTEGSGDKESTD